MNIDGGCVWKENERRGVVIIPPSIFTLRSFAPSLPRLLSLIRYVATATSLTHSLRRYRDFSRSLLRRLILTAGDLGFFIMLWLGAKPPVGLSNVVPVAGGGTPPSLGAKPPVGL